MRIVIEIPNAPIQDYQDLYHKIFGMAASEGLFDDKVKSRRALALKVVLDVLNGVVNGTPLPEGHGDLIDVDALTPDYLYENGEFHAVGVVQLQYAPRIIPADKDGN